MTTAAKQEEHITETGCNFLDSRSVHANEEEHRQPTSTAHCFLKLAGKVKLH
jgi:hypothetical protein